MRYTQEEKKRMDRLIKAFEDYLNCNEEYDIAYSERSGYVLLVIAECGENLFFPIFGFEDMLRSLISSMGDSAAMDMLVEDTPDSVARFRSDCREIRKILEALPEEDREAAFALLDAYMVENLRKIEM